MERRKRQSGFTLIELIVVLALVAIFALVGIPSYENMMTTNRMATEINNLMADLQYARSESIMRGVNVSICASSDQQTCNSPSAGWNAGWVVTVPVSATVATPVLLRVHGKIGSNDLYSSSLALAGVQTTNTIVFDRNGFSANQGTITLNDHVSAVSRRQCLAISRVGQITLESGSICP